MSKYSFSFYKNSVKSTFSLLSHIFSYTYFRLKLNFSVLKTPVKMINLITFSTKQKRAFHNSILGISRKMLIYRTQTYLTKLRKKFQLPMMKMKKKLPRKLMRTKMMLRKMLRKIQTWHKVFQIMTELIQETSCVTIQSINYHHWLKEFYFNFKTRNC